MAVFTRISLSSALYFPIKTLRSFPLVSCFKFPFNFPKIPSLKSMLNLPEIPFLTNFPDSWPSNFSVPEEYLGRLLEGSKDRFLRWHFASGPDVNDPNGGVIGEEPEVAVVILGWLEAEPHHLRCYVEMYNAKGIHAVTFVPSMTEVLADSKHKMQDLAAELGSWLLKENGRSRFLLFHTFSNTGWFGYVGIWILDLSTLSPFMVLFDRRSHEIFTGLLMYQPSCQLYLYSTEDKVIPYQKVESVIETQRRIGRQVFSYNFESSGHVDHFRCFPDAYSSQVDKFLKVCLINEGRLLKQG